MDGSDQVVRRISTRLGLVRSFPKLPEHPKLYRGGRIEGTREMVVRANYIVVYTEDSFAVRILRVLHAAQQWPPTQE
ncbi:TPA: type II toxin-antitoxin system RelE/ParE family toxin [Serratia marcescens]|uniref:type II toxin-antitoxin system RelE/ParE family toxin n=1 Tax=Serratia marcescens TaxID=615 RepID=UPI0013DCA2C3|nr:type II toxin-antitoxin system RelE/ParE family toxin [Serratia marcescens]